MQFAQTRLHDRSAMSERSISFVNFESIHGVFMRDANHHAVTHDFCRDRRERDRGFRLITANNRFLIIEFFWRMQASIQ